MIRNLNYIAKFVVGMFLIASCARVGQLEKKPTTTLQQKEAQMKVRGTLFDIHSYHLDQELALTSKVYMKYNAMNNIPLCVQTEDNCVLLAYPPESLTHQVLDLVEVEGTLSSTHNVIVPTGIRVYKNGKWINLSI